ncbi:MAG: DUF4375 domain-containing protein [Verrucomicrobiota bacterium]
MDADYSLVDKAFCDCVASGQHKRWPFAKLKPGKVLCDVWHAKGLIGNGGFHCLIGSLGKRQVRQLIQAHEYIGLPETGKLVEEAYTLFNDAKRSVADPADVDAIRQRCEPRMTEIERDYYGSESELISAAAQYVRENRSSFSSLPNQKSDYSV